MAYAGPNLSLTLTPYSVASGPSYEPIQDTGDVSRLESSRMRGADALADVPPDSVAVSVGEQRGVGRLFAAGLYTSDAGL